MSDSADESCRKESHWKDCNHKKKPAYLTSSRRKEIDQGGTSGRPITGVINDQEQTISLLDVERKATGKEIVESKSKTKTMNKDKLLCAHM